MSTSTYTTATVFLMVPIMRCLLFRECTVAAGAGRPGALLYWRILFKETGVGLGAWAGWGNVPLGRVPHV